MNLNLDKLKNKSIIIGLSGGPDSVFLIHQLNNQKKELNLKIPNREIKNIQTVDDLIKVVEQNSDELI